MNKTIDFRSRVIRTHFGWYPKGIQFIGAMWFLWKCWVKKRSKESALWLSWKCVIVCVCISSLYWPAPLSQRWQVVAETRCLCRDISAGPPSSPQPCLYTHQRTKTNELKTQHQLTTPKSSRPPKYRQFTHLSPLYFMYAAGAETLAKCDISAPEMTPSSLHWK